MSRHVTPAQSPLGLFNFSLEGKTYQFDINQKIPVHDPIDTFPSHDPPPSTNVFGLSRTTYNTNKGQSYRVESGDNVNCMAITTYPLEVPQWENVFHLLDLSKTNVNTWSWSDYFGLYPAVLVTVDVEEAQHVTESYPDKEKYPHDRIATVAALKRALENVGLSSEQYSPFFAALLIRFSFLGNHISPNEHSLAHFSIDAARFIHDKLRSKWVAVQAPSVDRADCAGCDVHRILFGLETDPPQKTFPEEQKIPDVIVGENFHFRKEIVDGIYVLFANGVDFNGQDVTISASCLYKIKEINNKSRL